MAETGSELIITFRNSHDAIMAERRLLDSGVEVRVMPMPPQLGAACGIALRVNTEDIVKIKELLGETIHGIYQKNDGETFVLWNP
jgi:hypothetical protein